MYECNKKDSDDVNRIRNALVSRPLPYLRRSYISFHHLCGYDEPIDNGIIPNFCELTVQKDVHQEEEHTLGANRLNRSTLLFVPESRLSNDGNISKHTEWFYEYRALPQIDMNERIILNAEFDAKY